MHVMQNLEALYVLRFLLPWDDTHPDTTLCPKDLVPEECLDMDRNRQGLSDMLRALGGAEQKQWPSILAQHRRLLTRPR
jgi:hypothetical protein